MSGPSMQDRRTPRQVFEYLNDRLGPFKLDAFAEPHNALCERFLTRFEDGCSAPWEDVTFWNPEFEDMLRPTVHAVHEANFRNVRSVGLGPVGCSQEWYQRWAIRGTIYVPDMRISFALPDGTPTDGADRDTIVMAFGREHANPRWQEGVFRVRRLPLSEAMSERAA